MAHGTRHPRLSRPQGRDRQAAAPHRRPDPRVAAHGRRRRLLHRRADAGVGGDQGAAERGGGSARRAPSTLRDRRRPFRRRGRGRPHRGRGDPGDRAAGAVVKTDEVAKLHASSAARERVELDVGGMTCASCAMRVERALNRLDGVEATVNYATERASVAYDTDRCDVDEMVGGVAALGYRATVRPPAGHVAAGEHAGPNGHDHGDERPHDLLVRLVVAAVFAAPVLAISMIGALQFDGWQWVVMALTAPVAIWAAWPFHRAMVINARHGAASMDTLVSIGVLAAFSWSVWAVVFTPAGDWGQSMDMAGSGGDVPHLYFEVAAAVVVALVGGRYLEARAKRRGGDALRALVELGAREASVLGAGGLEHRVPVDRLVVGDRFVVRPGEKVATDGVVVEG